ncbi:MAG: 16S rRNA (guanine(527)-N(7))-methyltransferase RsmG [Campylobacterota bacterium]|nr:16S rRNA (guanine(527)-N(7))-methyltransferase RsmG [Campylobacterota bacterium]
MLKKILESNDININDTKIEQLEAFASTLHEWNKIHNLTGAKDIETIYKNIVDSLYPMTFIDTPKSLLDVGSGAGFPAMPLAIVLEDTQVVLCEPLRKRVSFLKYASLGLDNVEVVASRVEDMNHEPFELITSRAVTNTQMLLDLTHHLASSQTRYLFYKGNCLFDEVKSLKNQLDYDIVQKQQRNYLYIKSQK